MRLLNWLVNLLSAETPAQPRRARLGGDPPRRAVNRGLRPAA